MQTELQRFRPCAILDSCDHLRSALSLHCRQRQEERRITDEELILALRHGTRLHRYGALVFHLRRKDMPEGLDDRQVRNLGGTTAVVSADGTIVTTYRNADAYRKLKRKPTRRDFRRPRRRN